MKLAADEFIFLCLLLLVVVILLFSWLPHPDIGNLPFFPERLGEWINEYGNLRTAVPFALIGFFGNIQKKRINGRLKESHILIGAFVLVTTAEAGQLLLPHRHFDIWDIFWGMEGTIAGIASAFLVKKLINKFLKTVY